MDRAATLDATTAALGACRRRVRWSPPPGVSGPGQCPAAPPCDRLVEDRKSCLAGPSQRLVARLLHLVRDSRGVLYSWQKGDPTAKRRSDVQDTQGQGPRALMHRYHTGSGALHYLAFNLLAPLLGGTNLPVSRIRYEDLV